MVVHIISLGLTAFVLYLSAPGTDLFSWHPSLMTVAFALLLSQVGFYTMTLYILYILFAHEQKCFMMV